MGRWMKERSGFKRFSKTQAVPSITIFAIFLWYQIVGYVGKIEASHPNRPMFEVGIEIVLDQRESAICGLMALAGEGQQPLGGC
jgi:hypothetical protein